MAYGGNPGSGSAAQRRDAVYLAVGDTDVNAQLLTDAEADYFLSESSDSINLASVQAARTIAAKIMRQPRVANSGVGGGSSVDPTKTAQYYFDLADRLEGELGLSADADAGGISVSENDVLTTDSDWVPPSFTVGMDDEPGTGRDCDLNDGCC